MSIFNIKKLIAIFLINFLFSSCATKQQPIISSDIANGKYDIANVKEDDHVIAMLLPLSGKYKTIGNNILNGAKIGVFEHGYKGLSIEVIDTKSKNYNPKEIINQLQQKNIRLIMGPLLSDEAELLAYYAKDTNLKIVSFSNNSALTAKGVLVMGLTPEEQAKKIINYAYIHENIENFFALLPDNLMGNNVANELKKLAENLAINIKSIKFYKDNKNLEQEFYNIVEHIHAQPLANNALIFPEGGKDLQKFDKLLPDVSKTRNKFQIYGFNYWDNEDIKNLANLEGAFFIKKESKKFAEFSKKYESYFGQIPLIAASFGYDAISLSLHLALENDFNFTAISKISGVNNDFVFDKYGVAIYALPIAKIQKDKIDIIEEDDINAVNIIRDSLY